MKAFEDFIERVPESGCWIWMGALRDGYGRIRMPQAPITSAHRLSYQMRNGEIPNGLCVLHRCDVRCCVNPDHLFVGDRRDNTQDAFKKGRLYQQLVTHCPQGHPYAGANLGMRGHTRFCKACQNIWVNQSRRRRAAAKADSVS